jgi:tetratricopeptide (TPR) repeat protein
MRSKHLLLGLMLFTATSSFSQNLLTPPGGGSNKAFVGEMIGITDVTIHYNRPGVKGREGKIWGDLVPYGYTDLGFGTSKAAPWRAGADENTVIEFSTDVMVEGKPLGAGKYALFIALQEKSAEVIFSKNTSSWGSFFYDPKEDALKVTVKPVTMATSTERLKYEFADQKTNSAEIAMYWEKLKIPFVVSTDLVKTQLESFRNELRTQKGFNSDAWVQAINYSVDNNTNLEEALQWSDYAMNGVFVGQKNFKTLSARAAVLNKLGRTAEADSLMKAAMAMASMQELNAYGRRLLRSKKPAEAMAAYKMNAERFPDTFITNVGLMRGYSANGDYKTALKYAKLAVNQAPDKPNKEAVEKMIKTLEEGKDIN